MLEHLVAQLKKWVIKKFDEAFDNGEDISQFVDYSKVRRPNLEQKRVNLDLPISRRNRDGADQDSYAPSYLATAARTSSCGHSFVITVWRDSSMLLTA